MDELDEYVQRARMLDRGAFVMAYRHLFLLKHAKPPELKFDAASGLLDGPTMMGKFAFDPAANRPQIAPVKKKPGNPEPWAFSIGRAATCDVVLRFPIVSQLHAHLSVDASGSIAIIDAGSANSTKCNGKRLLPKQTELLQIGDRIGFGPLEFELCDAERLHHLLASPASIGLRPLVSGRTRKAPQ
jgi:FHA domain-containing protein